MYPLVLVPPSGIPRPTPCSSIITSLFPGSSLCVPACHLSFHPRGVTCVPSSRRCSSSPHVAAHGLPHSSQCIGLATFRCFQCFQFSTLRLFLTSYWPIYYRSFVISFSWNLQGGPAGWRLLRTWGVFSWRLEVAVEVWRSPTDESNLWSVSLFVLFRFLPDRKSPPIYRGQPCLLQFYAFKH